MTLNQFELQLRPPYDPELSLRVWLRHPLEQVDIVEDGRFRRMFFRPGGPVILSLTPGGNREKPVCTVALEGAIGPDDLSWAMDMGRWILNDDAPLNEFYGRLGAADAELAALAGRMRGLRPHRSPSLFDTLVFAILGQQVNLNFTYICKAALEQKYARRADIGGREWIAGLEPDDFRSARSEDLREMKISFAKARAILEMAEAFRTVPMDRETLADFSTEEIIGMLTSLRGIGPWTAEYVCLRALGKHDVLPAGDAGLRNAIRRLYRIDKPTEAEIRSLGERWRPYRSLATYYLWTSLSLKN